MPKRPTPIDQLTYEQATAELETLVAALERETLPLEDALAHFARGQALAAHCAQLLSTAELRVRTLTPTGDLAEDTPEG